ncbi:hypothetical protein Bpfe_030656, partial [Biomphalaria pfeifferi]
MCQGICSPDFGIRSPDCVGDGLVASFPLDYKNSPSLCSQHHEVCTLSLQSPFSNVVRHDFRLPSRALKSPHVVTD